MTNDSKIDDDKMMVPSRGSLAEPPAPVVMTAGEAFARKAAGAIVTGGASLVPGGAAVKELVDQAIGLGNHSPEKKREKEQVEWLVDAVEHLHGDVREGFTILTRKLDVLRNEGVRVEYQEVKSILVELIEAGEKRTTTTKRARLKRAMSRSYDPEYFDKDIVYRFINLIRDLDEIDIQVLSKLDLLVKESSKTTIEMGSYTYGIPGGRTSMVLTSFSRLYSHGLIFSTKRFDDWHLYDGGSSICLTELALRFLDFLAAPEDPEVSEEE